MSIDQDASLPAKKSVELDPSGPRTIRTRSEATQHLCLGGTLGNGLR